MLDLDAFKDVPLCREPFDHLVVPGFLTPEALGGARDDFPNIARAGLHDALDPRAVTSRAAV